MESRMKEKKKKKEKRGVFGGWSGGRAEVGLIDERKVENASRARPKEGILQELCRPISRTISAFRLEEVVLSHLCASKHG